MDSSQCNLVEAMEQESAKTGCNVCDIYFSEHYEKSENSLKRPAKTEPEAKPKPKKQKTKKNKNVKNLKLNIPSETVTTAAPKVEEEEVPKVEEASVEVVAEGGAEGRDETSGKPGTYIYESIDELLASLDQIPVSRTCPIHKDTVLQIVTSQKETVHDTFLRCPEKGFPVFCTWNDYGRYASQCRCQGHAWFTKERIQDMKCECGFDPTLSISNSIKNKNRMYLRCRKGDCNLFTWWDRCPFKPVQQILTPVY